MPIALTLGLLTGLLNFIPNFGPLIAGVPAVLIALTISPQTALYVGLLYVAVQSIDGYIFTPLVNRRSVELPPVLTITAQVLLGVLVGSMGVVLAGPLTAMLIVIVRMLYLKMRWVTVVSGYLSSTSRISTDQVQSDCLSQVQSYYTDRRNKSGLAHRVMPFEGL